MITPQHTQMLMSALQTASQMRNTAAEVEHGRIKLQKLQLEQMHEAEVLDTELDHQRKMFGMKAGLVRDLIGALIEKRVDAIRESFEQVLTIYADQCKHYLTQQERYVDAEIKATDPLERANLRARLTEIDLHLGNIRADAAGLYREMSKVILLIGGAMPIMKHQTQHQLAITTTK
jgi:hypothetical protein